MARHLLGFQYIIHLWNTYDFQIYQCSFDFVRPFSAQKTMLKQRDHPHPDGDFQLLVEHGANIFLYSNKAEIKKIWH